MRLCVEMRGTLVGTVTGSRTTQLFLLLHIWAVRGKDKVLRWLPWQHSYFSLFCGHHGDILTSDHHFVVTMVTFLLGHHASTTKLSKARDHVKFGKKTKISRCQSSVVVKTIWPLALETLVVEACHLQLTLSAATVLMFVLEDIYSALSKILSDALLGDNNCF